MRRVRSVAILLSVLLLLGTISPASAQKEPVKPAPGMKEVPGQKKPEQQKLPDLIIESLEVPPSATAGDDIGRQIKLVVKNIGAGLAPGTRTHGANGYMVDLVLSRDTSVPAGFATYSATFREDVLLKGGRASNTEDLAPGAVQSYPIGAGIPADTPPGDYYLCATVDPGNRVAESNERNNTICRPIKIAAKAVALPDLYVVHFRYEGESVTAPTTFPLRTVTQGESKRVEVSIRNWGPADAVGDFGVGIYLSSVYPPGCRPTPTRLWGTMVTGGLRTVDVRTFSTTVTIPATLAPGNYWMYPMVDDTNRIAERNEDANCYNSVPLRVVGR